MDWCDFTYNLIWEFDRSRYVAKGSESSEELVQDHVLTDLHVSDQCAKIDLVEDNSTLVEYATLGIAEDVDCPYAKERYSFDICFLCNKWMSNFQAHNLFDNMLSRDFFHSWRVRHGECVIGGILLDRDQNKRCASAFFRCILDHLIHINEVSVFQSFSVGYGSVAMFISSFCCEPSSNRLCYGTLVWEHRTNEVNQGVVACILASEVYQASKELLQGCFRSDIYVKLSLFNPYRHICISSGFRLWFKEQDVRGFFRGWGPTVLGYNAQGTCKFGFYEFFNTYYTDLAGSENVVNKTFIYLTGSAIADVISDVARWPMEVVKVLVQTQPGFVRGLSDGFPKFVKAEGAFGVHDGLVPLWGRQIPYTVMKFASFEAMVEMLDKYVIPQPKEQCSKQLQLGVSFAHGYVAVFCAIVSYLADNLQSSRLNMCDEYVVGNYSLQELHSFLRICVINYGCHMSVRVTHLLLGALSYLHLWAAIVHCQLLDNNGCVMKFVYQLPVYILEFIYVPQDLCDVYDGTVEELTTGIHGESAHSHIRKFYSCISSSALARHYKQEDSIWSLLPFTQMILFVPRNTVFDCSSTKICSLSEHELSSVVIYGGRLDTGIKIYHTVFKGLLYTPMCCHTNIKDPFLLHEYEKCRSGAVLSPLGTTNNVEGLFLLLYDTRIQV